MQSVFACRIWQLTGSCIDIDEIAFRISVASKTNIDFYFVLYRWIIYIICCRKVCWAEYVYIWFFFFCTLPTWLMSANAELATRSCPQSQHGPHPWLADHVVFLWQRNCNAPAPSWDKQKEVWYSGFSTCSCTIPIGYMVVSFGTRRFSYLHSEIRFAWMHRLSKICEGKRCFAPTPWPAYGAR